jgi:hypothetical protein
MTVPNENNEVQVVLTSATQNIPTTFYFLESDNLTVKETDQSTTPVITTLTEGTHYTVNLPATVGGVGSIDMIGATIGDTITIIRCLDATQLVDYVDNDAFPAEVHEKALDRLTMLIGKIWSALFGTNKRFLQYPPTELGTDPTVPILSDRTAGGAGTIFGWKGTDGTPEPISKGTLTNPLTLSNASDLGGASPSAVNGATQAAIRNNLDTVIAGAGLTAITGAYPTPSGTNFLDSTTDIMDALDTLDEKVQCAWNGANDLNTRVTANETTLANQPTGNLVTAWCSFDGGGSKLDGSGNISVSHSGNGDYVFTITPALANANYAVIATGQNTNATVNNRTWVLQLKDSVAPTASSFTLSNAATFSSNNKALTSRGSVMIMGG